MSDFLHQSELELIYPWSEWLIEGKIDVYKVDDIPFIIYTNKSWKVDIFNNIIKIIWPDFGQVIINKLGQVDLDQTIEASLEYGLKKEMDKINLYSKIDLFWFPSRKLKINGLNALLRYTNGEINIDDKYKLNGRISIYIIYNEGYLVSLRISGAYTAKSLWGNREQILRSCIWSVKPKMVNTKNENNSELEKQKYKKTTISATGIKNIINSIKKVDSKIETMNKEMYSKFVDVEMWISDINDRINKIHEILERYEIFFDGMFSKMSIEDSDDE